MVEELVPLPVPSPDQVQAACSAFDQEPLTALDEKALGLLWSEFPDNTDPAAVLLKVIALDRLYSTRLFSIEIRPLAQHIASSEIDRLMREGSERALDVLTSCDHVRNIFSFATKYCSWHNPTAFPIWDNYVDQALWVYQKQFRFTPDKHREFKIYAEFRGRIDSFREHFGLQSFSYREIDKFLWTVGEELLRARATSTS